LGWLERRWRLRLRLTDRDVSAQRRRNLFTRTNCKERLVSLLPNVA
jgi:hypothetical protein